MDDAPVVAPLYQCVGNAPEIEEIRVFHAE
jgi:hypothetical protein